MFRSFFLNSRWRLWAWPGSLLILLCSWYKVQLNVDFNQWYGEFYNSIQQALTKPGSITFDDLTNHFLNFIKISGIFIVVMILLDFFIRHFVFRWRTATHHYYTENWPLIRHVEGASQRVQEDTMRFANLMERLGVAFLDALLTFIAFQPVLWELSHHVKSVPLLGEVSHSLIYVAVLSAVFGTVLLSVVGKKLPGLEFNNQKTEAALRKELVLGEEDTTRAEPMTISELFSHVRKNYLTMYSHYLYFDFSRQSFLQFSSLLPYIALAPTIITGAITLGILKQIVRAFDKVEGSMHYLVYSWPTIVELISVYKRLKKFEQQIDAAKQDKQETRYAG